jgi:nucleoid DNA-binding protein
MTKAEIVDIIAEGTGLTKLETQAVIDGFLATVRYALQKKERVDLRGFGNFYVVKRAARTTINPVSRVQIQIPEHFAPAFRPSKELKKYMNDSAEKKISDEEPISHFE